jgi:hypothetical protein
MMMAIELDSEIMCSFFVFLYSGCSRKCNILSVVNVIYYCQSTVEVKNFLMHVLHVGIK